MGASRSGARCAVEFLQEKKTGLAFRGPEVLVGLESVAVDIGQDHLVLIGKVVPAGVFGAGEPDEKKLVGILDVLVLVAAFAVGADKPA